VVVVREGKNFKGRVLSGIRLQNMNGAALMNGSADVGEG